MTEDDPFDLATTRAYLARVEDDLIHSYEDDLDLFPLAKGLLGEVDRLKSALAQYADRSRWEFVAVPLANGNVRLCATFDGGWGVAEAALAVALARRGTRSDR